MSPFSAQSNELVMDICLPRHRRQAGRDCDLMPGSCRHCLQGGGSHPRPRARFQSLAAGQAHGCVALWRLPTPVRLGAPTPMYRRLSGDSLGARLQRRRFELGLRRIDAAVEMGVDEKTLMWWERDEREPIVSAYPAVIAYLGYEPWEDPKTLDEALLAERRRRGIRIDQAAELVGVDEGTWRRWERGEWKPTRRTMAAVEAFLAGPAFAPWSDSPRDRRHRPC